MDCLSIVAVTCIVLGLILGLFIYLFESKSLGTEKLKTIAWIMLFVCIAVFCLMLVFSIPPG